MELLPDCGRVFSGNDYFDLGHLGQAVGWHGITSWSVG
ncbi:hypothetical protein I546_6271 [Mycobacterium kansasii 732]|nr:hypothetical protein I546_6271 [Mycobacterium kansasii 732]